MNYEEIAQWVIDNRYPKNEQSKMSDAEMYRTLIDKLTIPPKSMVSAEYWEQRCLLAEKCIEESPCDPDITKSQIEAFKAYHNFFKNNQPAPFNPNPKSIKDFIDKWNVGFEDSEQKAEFAADMEAELMAIFTKPFTPERTAEEEAERLVKSYGEAFRGDDNVFAIQDITNTITALQLRGLDTSYEESVLNILKGM